MLETMVVFGGLIIASSLGYIWGSVVFEAEQKGHALRAFSAAVFAALAGAVTMFCLSGESAAYACSGLVTGVPVFYTARNHYVPWYFGIGERRGYFGSPENDRRDAKADYCCVGVVFSALACFYIAQWGTHTLGIAEAFAVTLGGAVLVVIPAFGLWYCLKLLLSLLVNAVGSFFNTLNRIAAALC